MKTEMAADIVWETNLPLPLAGRGKVRDIYKAGEDKLLIVSTDRLSAFDVVLPDPIPYKGKVLNQISIFWFEQLAGMVPHHFISADIEKMGLPGEVVETYGAQLRGRSMLVKKTQPLPIECVVRGYVTGSGWKDYLKTGKVCGRELPAGLRQCDKLEAPIFTPATKEAEGHDINIDMQKAEEMAGKETARLVEKLSIEIYKKGRDYAGAKGILIADTKFEFGRLGGEIILIDEVMTPDSSRFWPKDQYQPGKDQPSFDKQIVRNYLLEIRWDQKAPGPRLPQDVIQKTSSAYQDAYRRLSGKELEK